MARRESRSCPALALEVTPPGALTNRQAAGPNHDPAACCRSQPLLRHILPFSAHQTQVVSGAVAGPGSFRA